MPDVNELSYLRAATQVFDTPLLLAESQGLLIGEYVASRMLGVVPPEPKGNRFRGEDAFEPGDKGPEWQGYARIGSVARISLMGELVNRGAWMGSYSGMTSYEGFAEQLNRAGADQEVSAIALDVNSPGGQAAGMVEAARLVRKINQIKPVIAVVNSTAASAAFGLISGATKIVMTESSEVGSIGVLWLHFDRSKQLEARGVKATIIHAGARKVDGHPFGPLEGDAKAHIEARVNAIMSQFVGLVSEHRGIEEQAVFDLEASMLGAGAAMEAGLADQIGTFDEVLEDLASARVGRTISQRKGLIMSENNQGPDASASGITQAQLDTAVATARKEGAAEGASAERGRIKAILDSEEAEGREELARHFAFDTDQAPEAANAALSKSAKAAAPKDEEGDDFASLKGQAAAGAALDFGGPANTEKPKSGLSKAVDRYAS
ncbi:S49 family peptidase [Roseibium sediminicola]|uniref:S49 family peptidase n=1 Tax=Roseibium sediminicola TaxID=2933272 RepID=A0ABT0GRC1_9HYPH|nr:S49 family peptidase [Roseibium sp. CAU 1639]MCK7611973.1 S49 family peptidase [Roseibium sp. CAU 1639]